ncbi:MAG: EamA family transporter [Actinomycetota bacterium]
MDPEVVFALLASASFAASHVVSKRGLQGTSVTAGLMVIVGCAWVVVSIPVLINPPGTVSAKSLALFAISGLFAPAVSRAAALAGVHALGPSISVPIQQGLRPLIVLPAAALLLGEAFGLLRGVGVALIVTGGWVLSRQPGGGTADVPIDHSLEEVEGPAGPSSMRTRVRQRTAAISRGFRPGIVYPVAAAFAYATSDLLVKSGLDSASEPAFGAMLSIGVGLLVWSIAHALPSIRRRFRLGREAGWLVLSGALMGTAILLLFNALDRGDVSLVAPVVATQPLLVFLFSALILRHLERRERSMIVASAIVVVGTILVSQ